MKACGLRYDSPYIRTHDCQLDTIHHAFGLTIVNYRTIAAGALGSCAGVMGALREVLLSSATVHIAHMFFGDSTWSPNADEHGQRHARGRHCPCDLDCFDSALVLVVGVEGDLS